MEALDRREWPQTEAEIYLLRSAMFAAQAIARDMEAAGRGDEIAEIAHNISKVAPELPPDSSDDTGEGGSPTASSAAMRSPLSAWICSLSAALSSVTSSARSRARLISTYSIFCVVRFG